MSSPTPQPNVPGRGIVASFGPRFWSVTVLVGVAAGLGGVALMELLRLVQHLAWNYNGPVIEGITFLHAVKATAPATRVLVLVIGGLVAGGGIVLLASSGAGDISEAIWLRGSRLPLFGSLARGAHSMIIVGLGASLGREAAPQLAAAGFASSVGRRTGLPEWQRRLLVACAAGAGMAAVYNVPLGGAIFALEVLLGTITLPLVLPAVATALIATATAWIALPNRPTYFVPDYRVSTTLVAWAVLAGPLAGLAAVGFIRIVARAHTVRPSAGVLRVGAPVLVFAALGVLAIPYPQLLGNGKNIVQLALVGRVAVVLLAALVVLKPLVTAACLGSGAPGGLFTPTLALGALLGGLLGEGWTQLWPGAPAGAFAMIGGAAVLAAAMQGPLAAVVLLFELTGQHSGLIVPVLLAVVEATVVARLLGAPSIYSARIRMDEHDGGDLRALREDSGDVELLSELSAPSDILPASVDGDRARPAGQPPSLGAAPPRGTARRDG